MNKPLYQHIASLLQAQANCLKSGNEEWLNRHGYRLNWLIKNHMPSGSGIDAGTELWDDSTPQKLRFKTSYHHMAEHGYDGWTDHTVIVTPCLMNGFSIRITGRNRNDIKDHLHNVFDAALCSEFDGNYPANL